MLEYLAKLQPYAEMVSQVLMCLTIVASALVRLPRFKEHKSRVGSWGSFLMKALNYMPTLGINPRTKKLQEAYAELEKNTKAG